MMKNVNKLSFSLLVGSLFVLSSCDMNKESAPTKEETPKAPASNKEISGAQDTSEVLYSLRGKPVITENSFKAYKEKFAELQPQYAPLLEDPSIQKQVFFGQKNEAVLSEWAKEQNLENNPKFQQELRDITEFGKRSLNVKWFQEAHPVKVTDAEIKQYYEENKNTPQLMAAPGGTEAEVVIFDTKDNAQAFFDKVKASPNKFEDVAKDDKLTVKKLGYVNKQSFDVEGPLREKILTLNNFPSIDIVDLKGKFAVYKAIGKKEAQYIAYDDVKEGIRRFLEQQKSAEGLMKELEVLEKKYGAQSSDYFDRQEKANAAEQKESQQGMPKPNMQQASAPRPA